MQPNKLTDYLKKDFSKVEYKPTGETFLSPVLSETVVRVMSRRLGGDLWSAPVEAFKVNWEAVSFYAVLS
jgi:hypothetical protein